MRKSSENLSFIGYNIKRDYQVDIRVTAVKPDICWTINPRSRKQMSRNVYISI